MNWATTSGDLSMYGVGVGLRLDGVDGRMGWFVGACHNYTLSLSLTPSLLTEPHLI